MQSQNFTCPVYKVTKRNALFVLSVLARMFCVSKNVIQTNLAIDQFFVVFSNKYTCSRTFYRENVSTETVLQKIYTRTKLSRVSITDHRLFAFCCNELALEILGVF